mgnify:CR=1 FL=1
MKLLVDIGHPAHVHLFKHTASSLQKKGWEVLFSVREKGENIELLQQYGLAFINYGYSGKSLATKVMSVWKKTRALYRIIKTFNPTISISHSSFYLSQVSRYCSIPNITLEDTGNMEQILLYLPFTNAILTPDSYHRNHGIKHFRYNGYHETAYIHPDFQSHIQVNTADLAGTVLIRLVDWTASHDLGQHGLSFQIINNIIELAASTCQVKILTEKTLPTSLQHLALNIQASELHEWLKNVKLYIGEGATLASECALMGIPTIYANSRNAGVIEEHAKAGLLYHFKSSEGVFGKAKEILNNPNAQHQHRLDAESYLKTRINLSRLLVWFIEEYPESKKIMKENPSCQKH